uniref:Uncharacterized protein n=1 Tax=viral metagenome TaxID=1070528 RepID=A0A6C0K1Z3_9ZZZZ
MLHLYNRSSNKPALPILFSGSPKPLLYQTSTVKPPSVISATHTVVDEPLADPVVTDVPMDEPAASDVPLVQKKSKNPRVQVNCKIIHSKNVLLND